MDPAPLNLTEMCQQVRERRVRPCNQALYADEQSIIRNRSQRVEVNHLPSIHPRSEWPDVASGATFEGSDASQVESSEKVAQSKTWTDQRRISDDPVACERTGAEKSSSQIDGPNRAHR